MLLLLLLLLLRLEASGEEGAEDNTGNFTTFSRSPFLITESGNVKASPISSFTTGAVSSPDRGRTSLSSCLLILLEAPEGPSVEPSGFRDAMGVGRALRERR